MPSKFLAETGKMYNIGKFCKKNAQQIKETCSALCFVYKDAEKSFLMVKIAMLTSMTLDVDSQVSHMHSWDSW